MVAFAHMECLVTFAVKELRYSVHAVLNMQKWISDRQHSVGDSARMKCLRSSRLAQECTCRRPVVAAIAPISFSKDQRNGDRQAYANSMLLGLDIDGIILDTLRDVHL